PDTVGDERTSLPMRHLSSITEGDPTSVTHHERSIAMSTRRDFMKTSGALIVGFSLGDSLLGQTATPARSLDLKQVDTWLAMHADNTATVYIGFAELGQGASTALLQVAAEELDLDLSQVKSVQLDTTVTPNQGGTYSSAAINRGSPQIRS